eukprot:4140244-Pleurochrysis_carterae.AAC.3
MIFPENTVPTVVLNHAVGTRSRGFAGNLENTNPIDVCYDNVWHQSTHSNSSGRNGVLYCKKGAYLDGHSRRVPVPQRNAYKPLPIFDKHVWPTSQLVMSPEGTF